MAAIGIGLIWGGYALSLWGYCLLRGYNVTFVSLVNPVHPYSGSWPPALIPAGQVLPTGQGKTLLSATAPAPAPPAAV